MQESKKNKALLIGLNYIGTSAQLSGCINDVTNIRKMLIENYGWSDKDIVVLTDKSTIKPTKENIISEFQNLIQSDANNLFFHYSGHGSYVRDTSGDEEDGRDECLIPLDYKNGYITDDEIHGLLKNIDDNKKLVMVIDACYSGTVVDLRYKLDCLSVTKENFTDNTNENKTNDDEYVFNNWSYDYSISEDYSYEKSKSNILTISGCRDNQTSADSYFNSQAQGALTYHLIQTLKANNYDVKLKYLLKDIHCMLKLAGYPQKPVIQTTKFPDFNQKFLL